MSDDIKAKIEAVFEKHRATLQKSSDGQKIMADERSIFIADFIKIRDCLVRPIMLAIGETVKSNGYDFKIVEKDEKVSAAPLREPSIPPSISIRFIRPESRYHDVDQYPGLSVIADNYRPLVRFHENMMWPSGGGQAGPAGETSLNNITEALIQDKILRVVTAVFR